MVQAGHLVSLIMDGWQWSRFWCWVTPRSLPFPASIPGLWVLKLGVAIAVTLTSVSLRFRYVKNCYELLQIMLTWGSLPGFGIV
ncbi:hypothetical protein N39L_30180 [Limnospira platensis NIES-39]|uniref:Transposase n=1 Tax=Limnospira platensis NIES-46 TaxID=1236695 RepID=A0A5M3T467_LIMPL|nr:hypothetical protein N39L_30180 [Arthrospira platensis NIES-39]GCE92651.1 hypothetical protein NIES46_06910 [Arthrospira platensis NIES-46]